MIKNIDLHEVLHNYQERNTELQRDKLLLEAYNILNGNTNKVDIDEEFNSLRDTNIINELTTNQYILFLFQ